MNRSALVCPRCQGRVLRLVALADQRPPLEAEPWTRLSFYAVTTAECVACGQIESLETLRLVAEPGEEAHARRCRENAQRGMDRALGRSRGSE